MTHLRATEPKRGAVLHDEKGTSPSEFSRLTGSKQAHADSEADHSQPNRLALGQTGCPARSWKSMHLWVCYTPIPKNIVNNDCTARPDQVQQLIKVGLIGPLVCICRKDRRNVRSSWRSLLSEACQARTMRQLPVQCAAAADA